ncbi:hypothetical protein F4777DRAFT_566138 [Nemania sp. FL0916]|nr:hypothetical protein F4777DRAFT_566138 [Nemania sp. FL0916]
MTIPTRMAVMSLVSARLTAPRMVLPLPPVILLLAPMVLAHATKPLRPESLMQLLFLRLGITPGLALLSYTTVHADMGTLCSAHLCRYRRTGSRLRGPSVANSPVFRRALLLDLVFKGVLHPARAAGGTESLYMERPSGSLGSSLRSSRSFV